jgi:hypothetical protein
MARINGAPAETLDNALLRMQERKASLKDSLPDAPAAADELLPLLETAERTRALLTPPAPSLEFVEAAGNKLQRRIRDARSKSKRQAPASMVQIFGARIPSAALAFVLVVVVLLTSGWGVRSASAQALPGDTLFPVKLGLEEASLTLSMSESGDVALLADIADRRIEEIRELAEKSRDADLLTGLGEYEKTLDRLDAAVEKLPAESGTAQLEDLQLRLGRQTGVLAGLRDQLPPSALDAVDRMIERSRESENFIEQLRQGADSVIPPSGQEKTATQDDNPTESVNTEDQTPELNNPTATPRLTDTDNSTDTLNPTHTDNPTNTAEPTHTDKPTHTDRPPNTPKPTHTDKPAHTPKPTNHHSETEHNGEDG